MLKLEKNILLHNYINFYFFYKLFMFNNFFNFNIKYKYKNLTVFNNFWRFKNLQLINIHLDKNFCLGHTLKYLIEKFRSSHLQYCNNIFVRIFKNDFYNIFFFKPKKKFINKKFKKFKKVKIKILKKSIIKRHIFRKNILKEVKNLKKKILKKKNIKGRRLIRVVLKRKRNVKKKKRNVKKKKRNIFKRNILKKNTIKKSIIKKIIFRGKIIRRNIIRRNIFKRNIFKRNIFKRNIFKRNIFKRNIIKKNVFNFLSFKDKRFKGRGKHLKNLIVNLRLKNCINFGSRYKMKGVPYAIDGERRKDFLSRIKDKKFLLRKLIGRIRIKKIILLVKFKKMSLKKKKFKKRKFWFNKKKLNFALKKINKFKKYNFVFNRFKFKYKSKIKFKNNKYTSPLKLYKKKKSNSVFKQNHINFFFLRRNFKSKNLILTKIFKAKNEKKKAFSFIFYIKNKKKIFISNAYNHFYFCIKKVNNSFFRYYKLPLKEPAKDKTIKKYIYLRSLVKKKLVELKKKNEAKIKLTDVEEYLLKYLWVDFIDFAYTKWMERYNKNWIKYFRKILPQISKRSMLNNKISFLKLTKIKPDIFKKKIIRIKKINFNFKKLKNKVYFHGNYLLNRFKYGKIYKFIKYIFYFYYKYTKNFNFINFFWKFFLNVHNNKYLIKKLYYKNYLKKKLDQKNLNVNKKYIFIKKIGKNINIILTNGRGEVKFHISSLKILGDELWMSKKDHYNNNLVFRQVVEKLKSNNVYLIDKIFHYLRPYKKKIIPTWFIGSLIRFLHFNGIKVSFIKKILKYSHGNFKNEFKICRLKRKKRRKRKFKRFF